MDSDFKKLYAEKIEQAEKILNLLSDFKTVRGISKLRRQVIAEKNFLIKSAASDVGERKNLTSNIVHFDALISVLLERKNCLAVLETFLYKDGDETKRLVVDVVAGKGEEWIKVIARSSKGLIQACRGDTHFGNRTILDQAKDFKNCAAQNPVLYSPPKTTFRFSSGVHPYLATKISKLGITVLGTVLPQSLEINLCTSEESLSSIASESEYEPDEASEAEWKQSEHPGNGLNSPDKKLNLDITTLIAYVSEMTNGGTCQNFRQKPLSLQAKSEQRVKVKELLDEFFEGRKLYCCETALQRFTEILNTVGGEREKERAANFLERVTVVPDCVSKQVKSLKVGGQIGSRAQIVFGTGDSLQAVTVSANVGFCRAAAHQSVHLATFLHEPRALSEQASNCSSLPQEEN